METNSLLVGFAAGFMIGSTIALLVKARNRPSFHELKEEVFYEELADLRRKIRLAHTKHHLRIAECAVESFLSYQHLMVDEVMIAQAQVDLENELSKKWYLKED
jgi:hypothetical protein